MDAKLSLALVYCSIEKVLECQQLEQQVVDWREKVLGPRHETTLIAKGSLARTYCRLEQPEEAKKLDEEVLTVRKEISGDFHPLTMRAKANLADTGYNGSLNLDPSLNQLTTTGPFPNGSS
jgi:hypothetical protein